MNLSFSRSMLLLGMFWDVQGAEAIPDKQWGPRGEEDECAGSVL